MHPNFPQYATPKACAGKTFIVTGANSGLGLELVKHLANAKAARIFMTVRNLAAGEKAKAEVQALPGNADVRIDVWAMDLASYESVRKLVQKVETELDRVDGVVANAGIALNTKDEAEGHPALVTVNVLSTFLFVTLIQKKLRETAKKYSTTSAITVIGSSWGFEDSTEWDAIKADPMSGLDTAGREEKDFEYRAYRMTKAIDIIVALYLARRLPVSETGVIINTTCPGLFKSNLGRSQPTEMTEYVSEKTEKYGWSAEQGARIPLYSILGGEEMHGHYIQNCKINDEGMPGWVMSEDGLKAAELAWNSIVKEVEQGAPILEDVLFKL